MSRLHKRLIAIFCIGVLLCGVGIGVTVTEVGELSYGGIQMLGDPDIRTENFDVAFEKAEEAWDVWSVGMGTRMVHFQIDNSVPKDTVRFLVTYNADRVEPYAYWSEQEGVVLSYVQDNYDDMALMMEAKDVFMQNLKEGKLVSFDTVGVEKVVILVNAESEENVIVRY